LFVSTMLFVRLFYIQVIHGDDFKQIASGQYVAPKESSFDRGSIFFQDKDGKEISAATRLTAYTLAISPKDIKDPDDLYTKLSSVYPEINKELFYKKMEKKNDPYEEVAKKLTLEQEKKIENLKLKGIQLTPEYYRSYPYKTAGSQVIGFVGFNGSTLSGRYGLERYYNDVLSRGTDGVYVNFFAEIFSDVGKTLFSSDREREGDLVLTIEPNVQLFLEDQLKVMQEKWHSDSGGMIIMDPNTGKIVAMGAYPSFDPNDIKDSKTANFSNPLVKKVDENGVNLENGQMISGKTVLWVAGVTPNLPQLPLEIKRHQSGRIFVNKFLEAEGVKDIFVLGDIATLIPENNDQKPTSPTPMLAQVAVQEAKIVATNIIAKINNAPLNKFELKLKGSMVSLGQWMAIGEIFGVKISGKLTWWLWRTVYLFKFISWRKRFKIALEWTIGLFSKRDITRLS
jgi:hypothetical protein